MTKPNRELLKFQINQLRKDNISYAAEACATSLICLLISILATKLLSGTTQTVVMGAVTVIAIIYTLYMWVGNFLRIQKIGDLERILEAK